MRYAPASRIMARTTLDLDPSVLQELRGRSKREGKSMGQVASELLAGALHEPAKPSEPFRWISRNLGLRVDPADKEAIWRILDKRE
jgi:hypothetical protein